MRLTETMCALSVIFITEGLRDPSICCLHFVLNQQVVPGIFNHSLDGVTALPSRPKIGLTLHRAALTPRNGATAPPTHPLNTHTHTHAGSH